MRQVRSFPGFVIAALLLNLLAGCGSGGNGSASTSGLSPATSNAPVPVVSTVGGDSRVTTPTALAKATPVPTPTAPISAPTSVIGGQSGYAASVTAQSGCTYTWTVTNGTLMVGQGTDSIAFTAGTSGTVTLSCKVTNTAGGSTTGTAMASITTAKTPAYNISQCLSDQAQSTTIAFSGFAMMTGNLQAQSFFPPGKVADYFGFQYLRDNDPDSMGHNTDFQTRVSCNVLYLLTDAQLASLKALATSQVSNVNLYAWKRYTLMKAFRRLMDGPLPTGTTGLSLANVTAASRVLYQLDGQISCERAVLYADILRSLSASQKSALGAMVGKGFSAWPSRGMTDVQAKLQGLTNDQCVAVMTYAGDIFAWYAGSTTADVYFCPERHGTYFGGFYVKDGPAVGNPGYSISQTMTGTVGKALCDSSLGYISAAGAAKMNALVSTQRANLYGSSTASIVLMRTRVSQALRSLISSTAPTAAAVTQLKATVATLSGTYGDLDGANNYAYATTFWQIYNNIGGTYLSTAQKSALSTLRKQCMTVTYTNGTTKDFSSCSTYFLYAAQVPATSSDLLNYTSDALTTPLFTR